MAAVSSPDGRHIEKREDPGNEVDLNLVKISKNKLRLHELTSDLILISVCKAPWDRSYVPYISLIIFLLSLSDVFFSLFCRMNQCMKS